MTGALVILVVLVIIGGLLYITDVKYFRHHHSGEERNEIKDEEKGIKSEEICCGQHVVCEKNSLRVLSDEIIYYDDEELDIFAGRSPESYSANEIEQFRDVLMTLLPQDVVGWAKSINLRKIELPSEIRDELLMIVSELRSI